MQPLNDEHWEVRQGALSVPPGFPECCLSARSEPGACLTVQVDEGCEVPLLEGFDRLRCLTIEGWRWYRRGALSTARLPLLEHLTLRHTGALRDLDHLAETPQLRHLTIGRGTWGSPAHLVHLPQIQSLHLEDCREVRDLGFLRVMTGLQALRLDACHQLGDVEALAALTGLVSVELNGAWQLVDLVPLTRLGALRHLKVDPCTNVDVTPILDRIRDGGVVLVGPIYRHLSADHLRTLDPTISPVIAAHQEGASLDGLSKLSDDEAEAAFPGASGLLSLDGLKALGPAIAASLGRHHGDLRLRSLSSLSHEAAIGLAGCGGRLQLDGLATLEPGVAAALGSHRGGLSLRGLSTLSAEVARCFCLNREAASAEHHHDGSNDLSLDGVTELSDEAALALVGHCGDLSLDGIRHLSSVATEALARVHGTLSLDGITRLPTTALLALAERADDLSLDGLQDVSELGARALAAGPGDLSLDGLAVLSQPVALALSACSGDLSLNGLREVTADVAAALARHVGRLSLDGVATLSDGVARALAGHRGALSLHGVVHLTDRAAEALSWVDGDLGLRGLRRVSRRVALALCRHGRVQLDAIAVLAVRTHGHLPTWGEATAAEAPNLEPSDWCEEPTSWGDDDDDPFEGWEGAETEDAVHDPMEVQPLQGPVRPWVAMPPGRGGGGRVRGPKKAPPRPPAALPVTTTVRWSPGADLPAATRRTYEILGRVFQRRTLWADLSDTTRKTLLALAAVEPDWVRSPTAWRSTSGSEAAQRQDFVQWTLARYAVPAWLDRVWEGPAIVFPQAFRGEWQVRLYLHLARGGSLRRFETLPCALTAAMAHALLQAPPQLSVMQAFAWAVVRGAGADEARTTAVITALPEPDLRDPALREMLAWVAVRPDVRAVDLPVILGFLLHERQEAGEPIRLAGRTGADVTAQALAWDAANRRPARLPLRASPPLTWPGSGFPRAANISADGRSYQVVELTSYADLAAESRDLRHCVIGYADRAARWESAIFSLRDEAGKRLLTIEVHPRSRRIVQVRGKLNRAMSPDEAQIVAAWAALAGLDPPGAGNRGG